MTKNWWIRLMRQNFHSIERMMESKDFSVQFSLVFNVTKHCYWTTTCVFKKFFRAAKMREPYFTVKCFIWHQNGKLSWPYMRLLFTFILRDDCFHLLSPYRHFLYFHQYLLWSIEKKKNSMIKWNSWQCWLLYFDMLYRSKYLYTVTLSISDKSLSVY